LSFDFQGSGASHHVLLYVTILRNVKLLGRVSAYLNNYVENQSIINPQPFLLQRSSSQVWVQALGRALYQTGYGTIQFFIPLIFVNQLGFSAAVVGMGVGIGSLSGVLGHFLGGYLADSPRYGRKQALLFSAGLAITAALMLALMPNLPILIITNLIMGLSAGCYWTAADATVVDVTPKEQREKAFAVLVLADSFGTGLGIVGGGLILSSTGIFQTLFLVCALILLVFLILIQIALEDVQLEGHEHSDALEGFVLGLKDRALQLFVLFNVLFTTYIALVSSTLPLYFTNFISTNISQETVNGESSLASVANLFTWCYVGVGAVLQLPLVQILNSFSNVHVLMISMLLWSGGFFLVWSTHFLQSIPIVGMIAALTTLSIASAIYKPFAPTIVAELAPRSLRGVYLAISYQCWSIGYFVGPIIGGWAMAQSSAVAHYFWLITAVSTFLGLIMLYILKQSQESNRAAISS
jgi:MFS family permease